MQKVLCTLFGSIPNKLTTCFHKRWMRQLLAAEVHRQTKPTFDHTWSVDETMWLRASCFYVKYPAFLHIWFSLQTFNIVIDCKIAMQLCTRKDTHFEHSPVFWVVARTCSNLFPIWEASWATLAHQPFYQLPCFLSGLHWSKQDFWRFSVFTTKKGTIKGVWQSYCQSQHKLYLSSSPAFWITYLFSTHAL